MARSRIKILRKTPAELGYTFPPEWHPHAATWLSWPRPRGISFPGKYHTIPENLARIIREIQLREPVHINVPGPRWKQIVSRHLGECGCPTGNVFFHFIKTNEPWCRDHGPAFLIRQPQDSPRRRSELQPRSSTLSPLALVDWGFNAWGGKYPPWDDDDAVPTNIARELNRPVFYPTGGGGVSSERAKRGGAAGDTVVMEGGSVDFNGAGTVMTTASCLLNRNRNPSLSKKQIEWYLKAYYGQKHVIWLGQGIAGDDTDGHIDDLARFINPRTIVIGVEDDPKDANYDILRDNLSRLRKLKDQDGRRFRIIELPMPGVIEHAGQRLPATYMNFYFINGALLVPTYRHRKNDKRAMEILQQHLPKHKVIDIDCVELIWGLGAIHCLTQQQPST